MYSRKLESDWIAQCASRRIAKEKEHVQPLWHKQNLIVDRKTTQLSRSKRVVIRKSEPLVDYLMLCVTLVMHASHKCCMSHTSAVRVILVLYASHQCYMRHTGDARVTLVQYITLVLCVTLVMHASHWCSKKRIF